MKPLVYCRATGKGEHSFYLSTVCGEYFLFKQNYRKGVHAYFRSGMRIEDIGNHAKAKGDHAVIHTLCKLPTYIRYIEKEYGIAVLSQTLKKQKSVQPLAKLSA